MPSPTERGQALDAALSQAIAFQNGGELDKALAIYQQVLAEEPAHPTGLHYFGIYLFQAGRHEDALAHLRLSCELAPGNAGWHNDLGNVLFALEHYEPAAASYEAAVRMVPRDPSVWNNLGAARLKLARHEDAIAAFQQAIDIDPEFGPALALLGMAYEAVGQTVESAVYQCRAYVLPPYEGKSKHHLGISFYFLGRLEEAAQVYRAWLDEEPGDPIAEHMLAACSQRAVPSRAPDRYVAACFDSMAEEFDKHLIEDLRYSGPRLIGEGIATIAPPAGQFDILDVGCGTGLCAPDLAPYARSLTGIDLSAGMMDKAAARGLYDVLEQREITGYLDTRAEAFDVVVACDTLIYFGELEAVVGGIARVLRPGGHFVFTTERVPEGEAAPYELHPSGRYRHAEAYVEEVLGKAGFRITHARRDMIREELGRPAWGTLVVARREA